MGPVGGLPIYPANQHSGRPESGATRRLTRIALLGAVGAVLAVVESLMPRPVPWVRLGLGHVAVLLALWSDGAWAALGTMAIKIALAGAIGGTLFHPTTWVASVAGIAAWMAMVLIRAGSPSGYIGPVGVSIAGATAYGLAQVWLMSVWLVQAPLWRIAPLVIGPGVAAGALTGLVAALVMWRLHMWRPEEERCGVA